MSSISSALNRAFGPRPASRVVSVRTRRPAPAAPVQQPARQAGPDLSALMSGIQGQFDAANKANLERYQNLLAGVENTRRQVSGIYDQALAGLEGAGTAARGRIAENMTRSLGMADQDLISRGLGNTTVRSNVQRGIRSDAERANQEVDERVAQQRAGLLAQRAGMEADLGRFAADATLSRVDEVPDLGAYTSLISAMASEGGLNLDQETLRRLGLLR